MRTAKQEATNKYSHILICIIINILYIGVYFAN